MSSHIVVGFDGTSRGRAAVARAISLARKDAPCRVVVVCTHDRPPDFSHAPFLLGRFDDTIWVREWERETAEDLAHEIMRIRLAGVEAAASCSLTEPAELLSSVAHEVEANCIVLADDRQGALYDLFMGSTVKRLLRDSDVPVVVV